MYLAPLREAFQMNYLSTITSDLFLTIAPYLATICHICPFDGFADSMTNNNLESFDSPSVNNYILVDCVGYLAFGNGVG